MSKKLVFLVSIVSAFAIIAGCSSVVKDNTMKAIHMTPNVQGAKMVAELEVAGKKVIGQAKGKTPSKNQLEKEAIAEALKQSDSDVLVGANFFYEYVNNVDLTVTVIGYPARYKNFKPKEVCNTPEKDILVGGNFYYEDGSQNNISVTIKNPKSTETKSTEAKPTEAEPIMQQNPVNTEIPAAR